MPCIKLRPSCIFDSRNCIFEIYPENCSNLYFFIVCYHLENCILEIYLIPHSRNASTKRSSDLIRNHLIHVGKARSYPYATNNSSFWNSKNHDTITSQLAKQTEMTADYIITNCKTQPSRSP